MQDEITRPKEYSRFVENNPLKIEKCLRFQFLFSFVRKNSKKKEKKSTNNRRLIFILSNPVFYFMLQVRRYLLKLTHKQVSTIYKVSIVDFI